MKKIIVIFLLFTLSFNSDGQVVRLLNTNPTSNDTLNFELFTTISTVALNCGSIISNSYQISQDSLFLNNNFNVFPYTNMGTCNRFDTIKIAPLLPGKYYVHNSVFWTDSFGGVNSTPFFNFLHSTYLDSFIVSNVTALKEYEPLLINIYPNPTKDFLYLESFNKTDFESLEIINIQGQLIWQEVVKSSIDVSRLSSGVYFLRLVGDRVYQQMFVKE